MIDRTIEELLADAEAWVERERREAAVRLAQRAPIVGLPSILRRRLHLVKSPATGEP